MAIPLDPKQIVSFEELLMLWATIGREPKVTGMVPCKLR